MFFCVILILRHRPSYSSPQTNWGKPHCSRWGENHWRPRSHVDARRHRRAHALPDAWSWHDVGGWLLPGHQGSAGWRHHHDQWVTSFFSIRFPEVQDALICQTTRWQLSARSSVDGLQTGKTQAIDQLKTPFIWKSNSTEFLCNVLTLLERNHKIRTDKRLNSCPVK